MKALLALVLLGASFLGAWTTDAQACSCERLSRQQLRDRLPLSFDGYVTELEDLKAVVRAKVRVVRKLKGDISDQLDMFAWRTTLGCADVGGAFKVSLVA